MLSSVTGPSVRHCPYWAYDEIAWAYENGYMSGTSTTAFTPGGMVTRQ